jgi:hypothetical protein
MPGLPVLVIVKATPTQPTTLRGFYYHAKPLFTYTYVCLWIDILAVCLIAVAT